MAMTRRTLLVRGAAVLLAPAVEACALPPRQIAALRGAVRGRVFVPGVSGYNAARVVFNRRWDGVRPPAVVQVRDSADVRAVVRWAERYGMPLVARSGGHGYNGDSTSATGVVVDLRHLDGVHSRDGVATLGPAARLGDVYAKLAAHGVTVPAGSCPTVAAGGLTPGGGVGVAGRAPRPTLAPGTSFRVVPPPRARPRAGDRRPVLGLR